MKNNRTLTRNIIHIVLLFTVTCAYAQDSLFVDTSDVYYIVEDMPSFEDETDFHQGFMRFFMRHFTYPEELMDEYGIISTFRIEFIVSKDGKIVNGKMTARRVDSEEINALFQQEFDRMVKLLPKINAGKQKGKYVNVKFTIPLSVNLQ